GHGHGDQRERDQDAEGYDGRRCGNVGSSWCERREIIRQWLWIRTGYSRNGHCTHGTRSKNIGTEWKQPGLGCVKCICNRWCLHDVRQLRKSVPDLHGLNGPCGGFCGERIEETE